MADEWCLGQVFNPAEEEIVGFYLKQAAMGKLLPFFAESAVRGVNVYDNNAPWEMFAEELAQGSRVFFVITRLVKRSKERMNRIVGSRGTWKGQSVKRKIMVGDVRAERYTLSFMKQETNDEQAASEQTNKKKKKMVSTHWNMVEYRVLSYSGECDLDQDVIFCRLTYSGPKHKSSSVPSLTSSSAVGGNKRDRQKGDESINSRTSKRVKQEQQQDAGGLTTYPALNYQTGGGLGDNDYDAMASYVETGNEHGEAAHDQYLHSINFHAPMDDNDGGLTNNTTEEAIQWSATAQPAPAALEFQEVENVDWAQTDEHGGIFRPEEALDDDVDFSALNAWLEQQERPGVLGTQEAHSHVSTHPKWV